MIEISDELQKYVKIMEYIDEKADEARQSGGGGIVNVLMGARIIASVTDDLGNLVTEKPHYMPLVRFALDYIVDSFHLPTDRRPEMEGAA